MNEFYKEDNVFHPSVVYSKETQFGYRVDAGYSKQWNLQEYDNGDEFTFPELCLVWELPKNMRDPHIFFTTTFPHLDKAPEMLRAG